MPGLDLSRLRVLAVDDNALVRTMIKFSLQALGISETHLASSGAQGLELLALVKPDLVLLDWAMEPPDGPDFVRRVRSDTASPLRYVPIIMVTAFADVRRVRLARDAGANEFISKPFAARTLYTKIRALVENPRLFVDSPGYAGPDRRRRAHAVGHERRVAHPEPAGGLSMLDAALPA